MEPLRLIGPTACYIVVKLHNFGYLPERASLLGCHVTQDIAQSAHMFRVI